ncbi:putative Wzy [Vibrio chagasii]|nr:putative Wzy [Vibrio chagasii]CAH7328954.1 putative Wzy [Vibrio chagasii]
MNLTITFVFFILIFLSVFEYYHKEENEKLLGFVSSLLLLSLGVLVCVNYGLPDKLNYIEIFELLPSNLTTPIDYGLVHGEKGFLFLTTLLKSIGFSYNLVFLFYYFLSLAILLFVFNFKLKYTCFIIVCYFSHAYLNKELIQIRAGLVSSLFLLCLYYLSVGRTKLTLILIFLGSLFHTSILIFFITYIANCFLRFNRDRIIKFSLMALVLSLGLAFIFPSKKIIELLAIIGLVPVSVTNYINWDNFNYELGVFNPLTVKQIFLSFLSIYIVHVYKVRERFFLISITAYVISTSWLIFFNDFAILAARVASVMSVSEFVIMSYFLMLSKSKGYFFFVFTIISIFMFMTNVFVKDILGDFYTEVI